MSAPLWSRPEGKVIEFNKSCSQYKATGKYISLQSQDAWFLNIINCLAVSAIKSQFDSKEVNALALFILFYSHMNSPLVAMDRLTKVALRNVILSI